MSQELLPSAGCCTSCDDTPVVVNTPGPQGPAGANGTNGTNGDNAFTTLAATFTIPALNSTASCSVVDGDPIPTSASGQIWVAITGAGYFQVISKASNTLTLKNPASGILAVANTAPATAISAGTLLAVSGAVGAAGPAGSSGAPSSALYIVEQPDSGLSSEIALSSFTAGYMKTAGSGGSGAVSTVSTIPVADVLGTLPISKGGTGITTVPANGAIPIGNGSGYVATTITAGTGITVTNGAGSITIAAGGTTASTATFTRQVSGSSGLGTAPYLAAGSTTNPFNATTYGSASYTGIDTASGFSSSTGRYTVQTTGQYRISACINFKTPSGTSSVTARILKNGSPVYSSFAATATSSGYHALVIEWMDTGTASTTYYEINVAAVADVYVDQGSQFSVFRTS